MFLDIDIRNYDASGLTKRCSEPLTSRHLLPPPPCHLPCRCCAVLRGRWGWVVRHLEERANALRTHSI